MNILVIGSLNMDLVVNVSAIPKRGETVYGEGFAYVCGGKGANQAIAASKLGSKVKMIGSVGRDIFGEKLCENLRAASVDTEGIEIVDGSSGIAVITVCNGDNSIILDKGANSKTSPCVIEKQRALVEWSDMIIMQFEIPDESVIYAAETAKKMGKKVLINPAPIREIDERLIRSTDIIVPNEHEAEGILGYKVNVESSERAVRDLLKKGFKQVIITLGKKGCAYNDGEEIKHFGIYESKVIDTTAAGDSFIAGICTALGEGKTIDEAISFATAVSAIVVSRKGAGTSIPTREETDEFLKNIKN